MAFSAECAHEKNPVSHILTPQKWNFWSLFTAKSPWRNEQRLNLLGQKTNKKRPSQKWQNSYWIFL